MSKGWWGLKLLIILALVLLGVFSFLVGFIVGSSNSYQIKVEILNGELKD